MLQLGDGLRFARKTLALLDEIPRLGLEHLDGDRYIEHHVMPRIHDAESTFGHEPVHAVLAVEKNTGQTKRMRT
jgi:hypothetical protein